MQKKMLVLSQVAPGRGWNLFSDLIKNSARWRCYIISKMCLFVGLSQCRAAVLWLWPVTFVPENGYEKIWRKALTHQKSLMIIRVACERVAPQKELQKSMISKSLEKYQFHLSRCTVVKFIDLKCEFSVINVVNLSVIKRCKPFSRAKRNLKTVSKNL